MQKGYKAFPVYFQKNNGSFPRFNIISSEGKYGESSLKMHLRTPHLSSEYEYIYISCNQGWFDKVRIASRVDLDFTLTRLRLQSSLPILSVLHVYFTSFLHQQHRFFSPQLWAAFVNIALSKHDEKQQNVISLNAQSRLTWTVFPLSYLLYYKQQLRKT